VVLNSEGVDPVRSEHNSGCFHCSESEPEKVLSQEGMAHGTLKED